MNVWDINGNSVPFDGSPVLNDLTRAPVYDVLPDEAKYIVVATLSQDNTPRLSLVKPDQFKNTVKLYKYNAVLSRAGVTLSVGPQPFVVDVVGVNVGDTLLVGSSNAPTGFGILSGAFCAIKDKVTVYMQCPALLNGSFTINLQITAIR